MVVAEVAEMRADALLERIWIRSVLEHCLVVVGLDYQVVSLADMLGCLLADEAEVGGEDEAAAVIRERVTHAVGGVVRYRESGYGEVTKLEMLAFLEELDGRRGEFLRHAEVVVHSVEHLVRGIDGDVENFAKDADGFYVVGMVVSDEESPDVAQLYSVVAEFAFDGACGYARVNQHAIFGRTEEVAVSTATAADAEELKGFHNTLIFQTAKLQKKMHNYAHKIIFLKKVFHNGAYVADFY